MNRNQSPFKRTIEWVGCKKYAENFNENIYKQWFSLLYSNDISCPFFRQKNATLPKRISLW